MIIQDSYVSKTDIVHDVRLSGLFAAIPAMRLGQETQILSLLARPYAKISEACLSLQYLWSDISETLAVLVVFSCFIGINVLTSYSPWCHGCFPTLAVLLGVGRGIS
jgi:hypothetical protein